MCKLVRAAIVVAVLFSPLAIGCSSKLSEEETPITATDTENTDAPVNNADNP